MFDLTSGDMAVLRAAAALDWSQVEPAIFGTLFERSLNPGKRSQLGAHYTSREDILLIVEPVVIEPLQHRWEAVKAEATALAEAAQKEALAEATAKKKGPRVPKTSQTVARHALRIGLRNCPKFASLTLRAAVEISCISLCGGCWICGTKSASSLQDMASRHSWRDRYTLRSSLGWKRTCTRKSWPRWWFGLVICNGSIRTASAGPQSRFCASSITSNIVMPSSHTMRKVQPVEPEWPEVDCIIGNPPFLGDKKMRAELGDEYVNELRQLYAGRVPGGADLVTFWFERARAQIQAGKAKRAGLLATNSIRMVGNRPVLERILESGGIFMAWSDRPWILDGAAVRVSMVGFDNGSQKERMLDGQSVSVIHADLTASADVASAQALPENAGLCFLGVMKGGPFDLTEEQASAMLAAPLNPNGKPNSDVVKRRLIGRDVVQRSQGGWLIDFGEMSKAAAALYELPFEYVKREVKPLRDKNRDRLMNQNWWLHGRSRPALRRALGGLQRCIVTPEVAKHRVFVWMKTDVVPDHKLHVIARDDEYFFGVLQSRLHEILATCSWMGVGNDPSYNSATTFETFPFPWPPGQEPKDSLLSGSYSNGGPQVSGEP